MNLSILLLLVAVTVALGILIAHAIAWCVRRAWAAKDEREAIARWANNGSNRYRV